MTEYATLLHAYGLAVDTPGHLAALAGDDPAARARALEHLWSAIIHQGTPWTATPPAALEVAALLSDPRVTDPGLRAELLNFLAAVAEAGRMTEGLSEPDFDVNAVLAEVLRDGDEEAIWEDERLPDALYLRAVLGCQQIVPALLATATAALSDPSPQVRAAAAYTIGACGRGDASRLEQLAEAAAPDERAALVLAIGDLGIAPRRHLQDPHPGVRACAALAPALAGDPAATAELLAALDDPTAADDWFTNRPPQLPTRMRFFLLAAAIDRLPAPDPLLPAAVRLAGVATAHTCDQDWGLLLRTFFAGYAGGPLTAVQRAYLSALTANLDLWDPTHGNAALAFRDAGLPYDRETCRALAQPSRCAT
ncbi:hypothetical protein [Micromonospora sp. NPDC049274]|uniref:hypothetical protein n=1 Tax=Micromonospora sp. NPDC049274 TaxID=3154829 RepID=UPI0034147E66